MPTAPLARLRRHLGWPLLLLLASLGIATVVGVQAQRAAGSHSRTAAQLLRDYSAIAAWSYGGHAERTIREAALHVLSPILHRELHPRNLGGWPDAHDLPVYRDSAIAWCRCEPGFEPALYLSWTVGAPPLETDALRADGAWPDTGTVLRLVDSVTRHVRDARQPRGRAGLVVLPEPGGRATVAAYGLMPTEWGDTVAYAFTFDPASLDAGLRALADTAELLPRAVARGVPNDSLLAVRVTAPTGAVLFASRDFPPADWRYQADAALDAEYGGLAVRATVRPGAAATLVAGGIPRPRLPLLLALLAVAAALGLVAVRQLRREQELARLRADFVASVSHELRTPLAQMRLFLETLRLGRWRTTEQRDWLVSHAEREATRLSHLVENVLAFARLGRDAAPRPRALAPTDVAAEVREGVRAFAPLAEACGVTLHVHAVDDAVAPLDRAAFRQVLLNLLDNAVKYGPPGQTVRVSVERVRVEREPARPGGAVVRVAVEDEGPGVPAAERARVWEPFVRGSGDAVRAVGGSGIGLAIVREVVGAHGGRARLEPIPSGGTRAVVELPAAPAAPAGAAGAAVPRADPVEEPAPVGGGR